MRLNGCELVPRRPFWPVTTQPDHAAYPSPNLQSEAGSPSAPGAQLVSDITYIPTREGWLYLAGVIDLFSRAILGWKLSDSLHADLVVNAATRAIQSGLVPRGAIFHSDRGCQYSATITRELLARHGLRQSLHGDAAIPEKLGRHSDAQLTARFGAGQPNGTFRPRPPQRTIRRGHADRCLLPIACEPRESGYRVDRRGTAFLCAVGGASGCGPCRWCSRGLVFAARGLRGRRDSLGSCARTHYGRLARSW
jgi:hypothetical protein